MSIYISTDDQKVGFVNASDKGRLIVIEGANVCFITSIGGNIARDYFYAGIAIKCCTLRYQLNFLYAIK